MKVLTPRSSRSLCSVRLYRRVRWVRRKRTPRRLHQPKIPTRSRSREAARNSKQSACRALHCSVQIEPLFPARDSSRASAGKVTFEPGARSAWHTHPLGQTLIITEGMGWIQQWEARSKRFERAMSSGFRRE